MIYTKIINKTRKNSFFLDSQIRRTIQIVGLSKFERVSCIILEDENKFGFTHPKSVIIAKSNGYRVLGFYELKGNAGEVQVTLFVNEIFRGIPLVFRFTPVVLFRLISALSSEVVCKSKDFEVKSFEKYKYNSDDENERAIFEFSNQILIDTKRKIRYLFWAFCSNEISQWHLSNAFLDYKEEKYETAKNRFYTAWQLNHENEIASKWYWNLRERDTLQK